MKKERVWYTCDYCGIDLLEAGLIKSDGYGGIRDDDCFCSSESIDICDKPECYNKHLKMLAEEMMDNDGLLLYPLDILVDEVGAEYNMLNNGKFKVKWNTEDKCHTYQRETLIKLVIPYYEKYVISGNGK